MAYSISKQCKLAVQYARVQMGTARAYLIQGGADSPALPLDREQIRAAADSIDSATSFLARSCPSWLLAGTSWNQHISPVFSTVKASS
jgi:hypothetical protein